MKKEINIFVDQEPNGKDIPDNAATGAWISVRDSRGHLHLPASTELGRTVMEKKLQVTAPPDAFQAARNLSELPRQRKATFARISSLLGTTL